MRNQSKPKSQLTTDEYDYQVVQEPLFNRDGKAVRVGRSPVMGNFRTDNDVCLGTSTDKYEIVNNGQIVESVEEALEALNIKDYTRKMQVAGDGARFYGVYDFENIVKPIAKGDDAGMRITLRNSFDLSSGVNIQIGMKRLVCLNGMTTLITDTDLSKRHSPRLDLGFMKESIQECEVKFASSIENLKALAEKPVSEDQGTLILGNLAQQHNFLSEQMKDSIVCEWLNPSSDNMVNGSFDRNLYNVYNAATWVLASGKNESATENKRFEQSRRTSKNILRHLTKAAQRDSHFDKLTAKIPVKEKIVTVTTL